MSGDHGSGSNTPSTSHGIPGLDFIGTNGTGVHDGIVKPSGATINTNWNTTPQEQGLVFYGTKGDGIFIQTTDENGTVSFEQKTIQDGLGSNFVSSIFVDHDGVIFAGTYHPDDFNQGGLSVSRDCGQTWETFRVNGVYDPLLRNRNAKLTGLRTNNVYDITRDRLTGKIIIATDDGVHTASVTPSNIIPMTIEASQAVNDEIEFSEFTTLNGLGSNEINTVRVMEETVPTVRQDEPTVRTTWFAGTQRGLSRSFDQGSTWKTFDLSYQLVDIDGPALNFNGPANNDNVAGLMNISIAAADSTAIKSVEISFDNQKFTSIPYNGNAFVTTYDTRSLPNGKAFLYARSTDSFGNVSNATPILINVNNPLPVSDLRIEIQEPRPNARISGVFPVKVSVISNVQIARVDISDNGTTFSQAKLAVPPRLVENSLTLYESIYEFLYDTTSLPTGDVVNMSARVTDENGKTATDTVSFGIYNKLPNVQSIAVVGNTIWSGTTNQCGLAYSPDGIKNPGNIRIFTTEDGLSSNNIQAVAVRKNEVWVGTDQGLDVSLDNGETWRNISPATNNLPGEDVRFIAFQGNVVWVGTTNGVGKLSTINGNFEVFRTTEGISGNEVYHIFVDCDQRTIWLSTNNGISVTRNGGLTWTILRKAGTGLPSNMVNAVARYQNKIYAATDDGLGVSKNEGQTFGRIVAPTIGHNIVTSLKVDGTDFWIGTFSGLTKLDSNGKFLTFRKSGVFSSFGERLSTQSIGLKSDQINYLNL